MTTFGKKYGMLVLAILLALLAAALPASARDQRDNRSHSDVSNGRNGRRIVEYRGGRGIQIPQVRVRGYRDYDYNRGRDYRYDRYGRRVSVRDVVSTVAVIGAVVAIDKIINRRPSRQVTQQDAQDDYIADQASASEIQSGNVYSYRNTTQRDVYVGYPQSAEGFYVAAGGVGQASSLLPVYGKFNGTFGPARVIWQGNIALIEAPTRGN